MLGFIQKRRLNWTAWCFHPYATPVMRCPRARLAPERIFQSSIFDPVHVARRGRRTLSPHENANTPRPSLRMSEGAAKGVAALGDAGVADGEGGFADIALAIPKQACGVFHAKLAEMGGERAPGLGGEELAEVGWTEAGRPGDGGQRDRSGEGRPHVGECASQGGMAVGRLGGRVARCHGFCHGLADTPEAMRVGL